MSEHQERLALEFDAKYGGSTHRCITYAELWLIQEWARRRTPVLPFRAARESLGGQYSSGHIADTQLGPLQTVMAVIDGVRVVGFAREVIHPTAEGEQ
jgi:hypothetical protein